MFSGIVEGTGSVIRREPTEQSVRFVIEAGAIAQGIKLGDSVANNGCCLTVVDIQGSQLSFDLLNETLERTNLKYLQPGSLVNLERSLCVGDRIGGHFVSGHVDDTGRILRFDLVGKDYEIEVQFNPRNAIYLVPKGSIALDGISLTIGHVTKSIFTVWIIPHTREVTNLQMYGPGSEVNLEFDMLAKYTEKILSVRAA